MENIKHTFSQQIVYIEPPLPKPTQIRVAGIERNSIVDGPGIRYTIFAQGCKLKCKGCHNPHTHDLSGGELMDIDRIAEEIRADGLLDGVTFSGGEPFLQPEAFAELASRVYRFGGMGIISYSGYTFEELFPNPRARTLLEELDLLIDGRFRLEKRSFSKRFRGSLNQRVIDVKESLKRGEAVEVSL